MQYHSNHPKTLPPLFNLPSWKCNERGQKNKDLIRFQLSLLFLHTKSVKPVCEQHVGFLRHCILTKFYTIWNQIQPFIIHQQRWGQFHLSCNGLYHAPLNSSLFERILLSSSLKRKCLNNESLSYSMLQNCNFNRLIFGHQLLTRYFINKLFAKA